MDQSVKDRETATPALDRHLIQAAAARSAEQMTPGPSTWTTDAPNAPREQRHKILVMLLA